MAASSNSVTVKVSSTPKPPLKVPKEAQAFAELKYTLLKGKMDVIINDFLNYLMFNTRNFKHETPEMRMRFSDDKVYKFRLELSGYDGHIRAFIENMTKDVIQIACEFQLLDDKNQPFHRLRFISPLANQGLGFSKFVAFKFLEEQAQKRLPRGALRVRCDLTIYIERHYVHHRGIKDERTELVQAYERMKDDLYRMFKEPQFTDFKLECGNREFPVHRAFLAARSDVFKAMLTNEKLAESMCGVAKVNDFEPDILEKLLEFIYTGTLSNEGDFNSYDLLVIADFYNVADLKNRCVMALARSLTMDNAITHLSIAKRYSSKYLEVRAAAMIAANFEVVKSSPNWKKMILGDPEVLGSVLKALIDLRN